MNRKKNELSLIIAIGGGLLFIVLPLTIAASGGFRLPDNSGGWFYEYQTLITGLVGAFIASVVAYQYYHMRYRKMLSARAKMNSALNDICSYARACFQALIQDTGKTKFNNSFLKIFEDAIEFLDVNTSDAVYQLIIQYQVHNARLDGYYETKQNREILFRDNREERLYDSTLLYALASRLFSYARGSDQYNQPVNSVKHIKPLNSEMHTALNALYGLNKKLIPQNDQTMKKLIVLINRRHRD